MTNKTENFFSEASGKLLSILGIIFIVLSLVIFLIYGNWEFSNSLNEEKVGQFGDFIGGVVGSLFSLAGVILFYVALKEQRRDININQENLRLQTEALNQQVDEFKEQKIELEETRKIYIEQTGLIREQTNLYVLQNKELKEQTSIAKLQQFDSSFFSYLSVLSELKSSYSQSVLSKDYFADVYEELKKIELDSLSLTETLNTIEHKYFEVFNNRKDELSIYFKTIYRIMVLIDSSNIDEFKKHQYFKLLRSQLSDYELLILHYNYQTHLGLNVRTLVIKYNLFKHLRILDRLEFINSFSQNDKNNLESFLIIVETEIKKGINKFSNIEEPQDVDFCFAHKFIGLESEIKIKINNEFQLSIVFEKDLFDSNTMIDREQLKKIIEYQLYSILFLAKYNIPTGQEITISVIECNSKLEFKYVINQIEKI